MPGLMSADTAEHSTRSQSRYARSEVASGGWTVEALRVVWDHQRARVADRIGVIERASAALAENRLGTELREEAGRAAHMLAGSLGMFGFIEASQAAHALEQGLTRPEATRAPALAALLGRVREGVRGEVTLGSGPPPRASSRRGARASAAAHPRPTR
jgi:Hpt domain